MAWKCIAEGKELADVRADRKESRSIEKYKVSGYRSEQQPNVSIGMSRATVD